MMVLTPMKLTFTQSSHFETPSTIYGKRTGQTAGLIEQNIAYLVQDKNNHDDCALRITAAIG